LTRSRSPSRSKAAEAAYLLRAYASLTAANPGDVEIDPFGFLSPPALLEVFLRQLAACSGGIYTRDRR
jgi:hypothetical protein